MRLQRFQIAQALGVAQNAEGERLVGNGQVGRDRRAQLQEHAVARAAFVELPGGIETARSVARSGRKTKPLTT